MDLEKRTQEQNRIIAGCLIILTVVIIAFNLFIYFDK